MTQIPITDSVSAYQATNQTASLGTCDVREGGWGQCPITVPNNASIGDPWGGYPLDFGTTNTSKDKWDDLTNVDRNPHQTAMGSLDYGVPVYKSDGPNPPLMTDYESERPSLTGKSQPTKGTSSDKHDDLTKGNSNPRKIVIGNHEYEVPICKNNSASPPLTIQCRSERPSPSCESQPTEETELGLGSVIAGTVAVAAVLGGAFFGACKMVDGPGENTNPSLRDTRVPLKQPYSTAGLNRSVANAPSAALGRVKKALGWKSEDTSDNEDVQHPVYRDLPSVSQVDDDKVNLEPSASSNNRTPSVSTSHPKRLARRSYIP